MGMGGISIWQLLIILAIVILIFGTKKLRNIGTDLGGAIKTFKKSMNEDGTEGDERKQNESDEASEEGVTNKVETEQDIETEEKKA